jgi:L-lactate utilization protein LutC
MNSNRNDLINEFIAAAELTTATTEIVQRNEKALAESLRKCFDSEQNILFANPQSIDEELFSEILKGSNIVRNPDNDQLTFIRTGVTDAFAGVAKTGSVCVYLENSINSAISMLTQKHVVVIESKTIVPLPRDIFSESNFKGNGLTKSFSFITGPSATADMGPLVRGVHGPGKLHIIILD